MSLTYLHTEQGNKEAKELTYQKKVQFYRVGNFYRAVHRGAGT